MEVVLEEKFTFSSIYSGTAGIIIHNTVLALFTKGAHYNIIEEQEIIT